MPNLSRSISFLGLFFYASVLHASGTSTPFIDLDGEHNKIEKQRILYKIRTPQVLVNTSYQMTKDVVDLLDKNAIPYWITFGTFMGAVRNQPTQSASKESGRIGGPFQWDDDIDLGVKTTSAEAILSLSSEFNSLGYDVFRDPQDIVGLKVVSRQNVEITEDSGEPIHFRPFIDLFLYEEEGDRYVIERPEGKKIFERGWYSKSQIDALERYPFGPLTLWGPSDPESYFTRMYGPSWNTVALFYMKHTATVSEKYKWTLDEESRIPSLPNMPLEERVIKDTSANPQCMKKPDTSRDNQAYWEKTYATNTTTHISKQPSPFCDFVVSHPLFMKDRDLLELGCGNGRDSFRLAETGVQITAIDASKNAIEANIAALAGKESKEASTLKFNAVKIESDESLQPFKHAQQVYARFFIHAIPPHIEAIVLKFFESLQKDSRLFLEYRTIRDSLLQRSEKISDNEGIHTHYRRFIDHKAFMQELKEKGYTVEYEAEADDFSVVEGDKPFLGRVIARKSG